MAAAGYACLFRRDWRRGVDLALDVWMRHGPDSVGTPPNRGHALARLGFRERLAGDESTGRGGRFGHPSCPILRVAQSRLRERRFSGETFPVPLSLRSARRAWTPIAFSFEDSGGGRADFAPAWWFLWGPASPAPAVWAPLGRCCPCVMTARRPTPEADQRDPPRAGATPALAPEKPTASAMALPFFRRPVVRKK